MVAPRLVAHSLRQVAWIPTAAGLRSPSVCRFLGDIDEIDPSLLSVVPSREWSSFERDIGVCRLEDWRDAAELANELLAVQPKTASGRGSASSGAALPLRSHFGWNPKRSWASTLIPWKRVMKSWKLSPACSAYLRTERSARYKSVTETRTWSSVVPVDVVPQVLDRWRLLRFSDEHMPVLYAAVGARRFDEVAETRPDPSWVELRTVEAPFDQGFLRDVLKLLLKAARAKAATVRRAEALEVRWHPGLDVHVLGRPTELGAFVDRERGRVAVGELSPVVLATALDQCFRGYRLRSNLLLAFAVAAQGSQHAAIVELARELDLDPEDFVALADEPDVRGGDHTGRRHHRRCSAIRSR